MLKKLFLRHACSTQINSTDIISGMPCISPEKASFRQYTTKRPMTAKGKTVPRYFINSGVLSSLKMINGKNLVHIVPRITAAMVMII